MPFQHLCGRTQMEATGHPTDLRLGEPQYHHQEFTGKSKWVSLGTAAEQVGVSLL